MSIVVPFFDGAKILVVGDLMLDRYWTGSTARISPEAPVPVVTIDDLQEVPGGAGNVAVNIAALGAEAKLSGIIGFDDAGQSLVTKLQAIGVDCHYIQSEKNPTITKLRVMSQNQQLIRLDFEKSYSEHLANSLSAQTIALLSQVDILVLSDYGKGSLRNSQELILAAKKCNVPVIVDPKGNDFSKYRQATIITPNLLEFEQIVGQCSSEKIIEERGRKLLQTLDLEALLITRGEQGMTLLEIDQSALHLPAHAHHVYDVTGAGDTVIAALACGIAANLPFKEAVSLANFAASVAVTKLGTASISRPELVQVVQQDIVVDREVMNAEHLKAAVDKAKQNGERIVMTNGCFDIIHAGHVGYLQQAKKLGDRLIVAINDDDSVKRLKGDGRPINAIRQRMAVLAGLSSVDWVVSFCEDTPEVLLEQIQPDILVKGGDYQSTDDVVGAAIVKAYGGDVAVLDFVDSHSTTEIVERMKAE